MIFISIIVPNYNHERFLKERLESILRQTYPHFELIILDDASTDNSRNILEQYRGHEKLAHLIYNDQNSGSPFLQWYTGIQKANHDWVWIAESDDSSDPQFLEKCVRQIQNHPTANIIVTQSDWVDVDGKKWFQRQTDFETEGLKKGITVLKDYLLFENPIKNASAVIFKKRKLHYPESAEIVNYKWCGDWALWNQLASSGDFYFISEPLNHFRRHQHAASNELFYRGYLYKEGLRLSLDYQKKLKTGFSFRLKALYRWTHHLFNQYAGNLRSGRFRLYLFSPLYYCVLMHALVPLVAFGKLIKKITTAKSQKQPNS